MKSIALLAALFAVNVFAAQPINAVLVKEIRQKANLMPPIDVNEKRVATFLQVEVMSGGCTKAEDFVVKVHQTLDAQRLSIVRIKPDPCDGLEQAITIDLQSRDLMLSSQQPILIVNPLLVNEQVVH